MSQALVGLLGVVLGGLIAGLTAHFTESARWRREQLLTLHEDLVALQAEKWPGNEWHVALRLIARIRVRMILLGHDASVLDDEFERRLLKARRTAERVPGDLVGKDDDEFVWVMSSEEGAAVDEHFARIMREVTPRGRRRRRG